MLSTPHFFVGAAIGSVVPNPIAAFALGFVSHFVLDQIPHWDPGTKLAPHNRPSSALGGLRDGKSAKVEPSTADWIFGGTEFLIGALLIAYVIKVNGQLSLSSPSAWGAIGAVTPDIIDNTPFWKEWIRLQPGFRSLHSVHDRFHFNPLMKYRYFGALTQLLVILLALLVLRQS